MIYLNLNDFIFNCSQCYFYVEKQFFKYSVIVFTTSNDLGHVYRLL